MFIKRFYRFDFKITLVPFLFFGFIVLNTLLAISHAQQPSITSDGTLGTKVTVDQSNYTIGEGTIRGNNQFHSFGQFNIFQGESANFTGPNTINNIIGRVTGGSQSFIDGLLRSEINGANLYLINPSGMLFGPNASLDVSGSFHVSTADFIRLGNDGILYASLSENSVLTIDPPSAFGFLGGNPAAIRIQKSFLEVPTGETISIVGGDIEISGDEEANFGSARVVAPGGQLNLISVSSEGEVILKGSGEAAGFTINSFESLGEISISKGAIASTSGESGGTVFIRGGRFTIDRAYVFADTGGNTDGASIGIDIDVAEDLSVVNGGGITADSYGAGTAGDIHITAGSLHMAGVPQSRSSFITSEAYSIGDCGNVYIKTGDIEVKDAAFISSAAYWSAGANSGNLEVIAKNVFLSGPESSPDPFGWDFTGMWTSPGWLGGEGGNMRVVADSLIMTNRSELDSSAYGPGHAGDLEVIANNIEILSGSAIIASAFGSGDGSIVNINADHLLISGVSPEIFTDITGHQSLSPSGIASQTGLNGGSAGGVKITAGSLEILDGARIGVETFGPGDGGIVDINVDSLKMSGVNTDLAELLIDSGNDPKYAAASILSAAYSFYLGDNATGNGGDLRIKANTIDLSEGALITSETEAPGAGGSIKIIGENVTLGSGASIAASSTLSWASTVGNAGDISITANNSFMSNNSSVTTAADRAKGGNITLTAPEVRLTNRAVVSAESSGEGNAGDINITATDIFWMEDSAVTTEAKQADGGNIKISTEYMVNLWDSKITASVDGGPDTVGGNISIDPQFVTLSNSKIIANAFEGRGGNIQIIADVFIADFDSVVDASSQLGIDGIVDIRAATKVVGQSLKPLPEHYKSAVALLREPCVARAAGGKYSSFVVSGRDALPIEPGGLLPSLISQ
jgi:filamentous hemagglutinin family protein